MSTASEKANLARIRDNQRRSRARRKEYLQELEARLRQCELQGIEASAEIQIAARRVADENKKLRGLLAQHGVGDENVEAYLQSSHSPASSSANFVMQSQYGCTSGAVQVLEQLLQARKPYCTDGAAMCSGLGNAGSRDSSQSTVQSLWDPNHTQRRAMQTMGKISTFMTPSSSRSRASNGSLGHTSTHSLAHLQALTPVSLPRNRSPASNDSRHQSQKLYDFDPSQLALSHAYNTTTTTTTHHQQQHQQHLRPHNMTQSSGVYVPTSNRSSPNNNANNLFSATDMVMNVSSAGREGDLGGCLGRMDDCGEDNGQQALDFHVLDQYTGGQGVDL